MAADVVPNGIKIEWNYTQNGVPVVNRVYTVTTGAPTEDDLEAARVAAVAFYDTIKGFQHSSCVLQNVTVTDVHVANGSQIIHPVTTDNTGTGTGAAAAANAAMTASLRTSKIGRSFRGRFYLGGLSMAQFSDAQHLTTGAAAAFVTLWSDFIDALGAAGQTLVVVSRYANKVLRVIALVTEVISVIVDTKVDSQRRRTAN